MMIYHLDFLNFAPHVDLLAVNPPLQLLIYLVMRKTTTPPHSWGFDLLVGHPHGCLFNCYTVLTSGVAFTRKLDIVS